SLASLGWGDDPPYPPSVGVPASSVGRARQRTRTVRGSRRVAPYHLPPTTYHSRLPRFARVGGRPPIPPECRRTGVVSGSRPSKNQDRSRIASGRFLPPTTYHLPPTTSASRLANTNRFPSHSPPPPGASCPA